MAPDAQTLRLTVDLDIASEPIRGSVDDGSGSVIDFAGWLELMSAFERATAKAAVDTDQPDRNAGQLERTGACRATRNGGRGIAPGRGGGPEAAAGWQRGYNGGRRGTQRQAERKDGQADDHEEQELRDQARIQRRRREVSREFPVAVTGGFSVKGINFPPGTVFANHPTVANWWGYPDWWHVRLARGPFGPGEPPPKTWTVKVSVKCAKK